MNMLLSNPEEQLLWKNVHDQRGDDSLWLRNFDEAAATFRGELVKRGNLHPPNCKQLSSWFERAALRHAVPPCQKDDIFRFGAEGCNIRKEATELRTTLANDPIDSHLLQLTHPIRRAKSGKAHRSSVKDRNRQRKAVDSKIEREEPQDRASEVQVVIPRNADEPAAVHHGKPSTLDFRSTSERQPDHPEGHAAFHNAMEENSELLRTSPVRSYHAARCRPDTDLHIPNLKSGTRSTPFDGTLVDRAYENIEILLGEDPKSYLPKDGELRDLRNKISLKIGSAVKIWLTASNTGQPQFFEAVRNASSFHLLKQIYGIGNKQELIGKIARMSKQHSIDVEVLLRALIGFAVFEWVFEAHHRSLDAVGDERATCETAKEVRNGLPRTSQIHPGDSHSMLLQLLSEISPQLRDQLERKSRYRYVKDDLNVDTHAGELASRMSLALEPFDPNRSLWRIAGAIDTWFRHLTGVFKAAIRLKLYTCLQPDAFAFHWPQAEEVFDLKWMQSESDELTASANPVYVTLFPALFRMDEGMASDFSTNEPPVFLAVVLQQCV
ncbi:MAG: hypothetical protein L6R36_002848 [Xanthoria steineri]|nr:MAG: hypothetical protein L6R36_002848 [Xanthoria steineri]